MKFVLTEFLSVSNKMVIYCNFSSIIVILIMQIVLFYRSG